MSLKRLALRDFVIVSELELELASGFSVLTGETGAGKSILIDALQLVTGGRADAGAIREGASRTDVSAEFDTSAAIDAWLDEAGFDANGSLLLRRTVDTQGKSRAWINGSAATATQLRELGEQLLDIHGQHAWQSLTRPEAVRGLLDAYAGLDTTALGRLWQAWRQAQAALAQAQSAQATLQTERERLSWQIGELVKLAPGTDEWDALNTEHGRLSNAQALLDAANGAVQSLDEEEHSAVQGLHRACQLLQHQEHVEPVFKGLAEVLASSLAQVEDTVHGLRAYLRRTELDPQRLAELDERLSLWMSLARRYRRDPAELPDLLAQWESDLKQLDAAADLAALEAAEQRALQLYQQEARRVSQGRGKAAPQLAQAITRAMQGLGMQGGQFEVGLTAAAQAMQHGLEDVGFLVAGHAGSTPRPVNKVASGGELSRLMLALKVVLARGSQVPTLVFDEVDAGIGGATAAAVGERLARVAERLQVLVVTHSPQVAARAGQQLRVAKQVRGDRARTTVEPLDAGERREEIARMLAGEQVTDAARAAADSLLAGRLL